MTPEQEARVTDLCRTIWDASAAALQEEGVATPLRWDEVDHTRHPSVAIAMKAVLRAVLPVVSASQRLSGTTGTMGSSTKE